MGSAVDFEKVREHVACGMCNLGAMNGAAKDEDAKRLIVEMLALEIRLKRIRELLHVDPATRVLFFDFGDERQVH